MFIGDKEIGKISSYSISTIKGCKGTISFTGYYDPQYESTEYFRNLIEKGTSEIVAFVYGPSGEKREARMKISYVSDTEITLEPLDEDIREWIKGWEWRGRESDEI